MKELFSKTWFIALLVGIAILLIIVTKYLNKSPKDDSVSKLKPEFRPGETIEERDNWRPSKSHHK